MKKRLTGYAILIALGGLLIIQIFYTPIDKRTSLPSASQFSIEEITEYDSLESLKYNGMILNNNEHLIDYRNDSFLIRKIMDDSLLIVRFSSFSCTPCVEHIISATIHYKKKYKNKKIAMFIANITVKLVVT